MRIACWFLLWGICLAGCDQAKFQLEFDREEMQQMVEEQFPLVKKNALAELTFSAPVVLLDQGDRLGLQLDVVASLLGTGPFTGQLAMEGRLHYDAETKAFFLYGAQLKRFELEDLSAGFARQVEEMAGEAITAYLATQPLYRLDTASAGGIVAKYTLRSVRVERGKVLVELGF